MSAASAFCTPDWRWAAFEDWLSGRAYAQQLGPEGRRFVVFRIKPEHTKSGRPEKAWWSDLAVAAYRDGTGLYDAAHAYSDARTPAVAPRRRRGRR